MDRKHQLNGERKFKCRFLLMFRELVYVFWSKCLRIIMLTMFNSPKHISENQSSDYYLLRRAHDDVASGKLTARPLADDLRSINAFFEKIQNSRHQ